MTTLRRRIAECDRQIAELEAKVAQTRGALRASHELLLRSAEAIAELQTEKERLVDCVSLGLRGVARSTGLGLG